MSIDNAVVFGTPRSCTEDDVINTSLSTALTTTAAGGVEGGSQSDIIPTADTLSLPSSEVSKGTDDDSTSKEEETSSSTFDSNKMLPFVDDGSVCVYVTRMGAGSTAEDAGAVCSEGAIALSAAGTNNKNSTNGVDVAGNTHAHTHTHT